jgi:hypothetical protein
MPCGKLFLFRSLFILPRVNPCRYDDRMYRRSHGAPERGALGERGSIPKDTTSGTAPSCTPSIIVREPKILSDQQISLFRGPVTDIQTPEGSDFRVATRDVNR